MHSVMIWGDPKSGKSAIIARLTNSSEVSPSSRIEKQFSYRDYQTKGTTVKLGEIGCSLDSQSMNHYLSLADLGLYCLDLSQSLDSEKIIKTITCFREVNPLAPIFLVGTKDDLLDDPREKQAKMDQLAYFLGAEVVGDCEDLGKEKFNKLFYTSSLNNHGIATLSQSIFDHFIPTINFSASLGYLSPESQLYRAIVQLKKSCDKLSLEKAYRIATETLTLVQTLTGFNQPDPSEPIKNYLKKCEAHLSGQNPKLKTILNLIVIVGMIALINALTAGIIFGVGLWFGWWMGPALVHNILITTFGTIKGKILVGSIATLGMSAEGLALYGLFGLLSDTSEISAIKKVAFHAKSEFFSCERSPSC